MIKSFFKALLAILAMTTLLGEVQAQGAQRDDYLIGAGDVIRIQVFQNRDLEVEARVTEGGVISFPLVGVIRVAGQSPSAIEQLIAKRLKDGNFLQNPQVTVNVREFRSQQVAVLGNVTRPGRYPLETTGMRLSEVLSLAGGVSAGFSESKSIWSTCSRRATWPRTFRCAQATSST
jgi:polysaccharide biosynthesis/export protein